MSTVTTTAYRCDRCGATAPAETDGAPDDWYTVEESHNGHGGHFDLCKRCGLGLAGYLYMIGENKV